MVRARPVASFPGRVVVLGFGSVGQGMLPLLLDGLALQTSQVTIVDARADETGEAAALDVRLLVQRITPDNLQDVLAPLLGEGDLLLNLSIEVASLALVSFCHPRGVLYLDACIEPWAGHYDDPALSATARSNYGLREEMLAFGRAHPRGPTACITQGANPGTGVLVRQGGAAAHGRRDRRPGRDAGCARRLGAARAGARRARDPRRRA